MLIRVRKLQRIQPHQTVLYPVLTYSVLEHGQTIAIDGFHDFASSTEDELAGMGLAIIGNICRGLYDHKFSPMADATITLSLDATTTIPCPWPGMPTPGPVPLDLTLMPFDTTMFITTQGTIQQKVDRWALMRKIKEVWVPWLTSQLSRAGCPGGNP